MMTNEKAKKLPKFEFLNALVDFFDNNDLGDYLENLPAAEFEVEAVENVYLFRLDEKLSGQIDQIAKREKTSSQALINQWLSERVKTASAA